MRLDYLRALFYEAWLEIWSELKTLGKDIKSGLKALSRPRFIVSFVLVVTILSIIISLRSNKPVTYVIIFMIALAILAFLLKVHYGGRPTYRIRQKERKIMEKVKV
jgi:amino acid permease